MLEYSSSDNCEHPTEVYSTKKSIHQTGEALLTSGPEWGGIKPQLLRLSANPLQLETLNSFSFRLRWGGSPCQLVWPEAKFCWVNASHPLGDVLPPNRRRRRRFGGNVLGLRDLAN
jgi:hypothetical protein